MLAKALFLSILASLLRLFPCSLDLTSPPVSNPAESILQDSRGDMIKVSVMYPNEPGNHFDITYYCEKHIPLVHQLVGPALRESAVDHGLSGMMPNTPPPYLAIGHLYFDSVDSFQQGFGPVLPQIVADLHHFTNAQPVVQISEVKLQSPTACDEPV